jgi:hypothetical protein
MRAPCTQVGLLLSVPDATAGWEGAKDVDCGVLGVEDGVPKGAALYAPTTNRCTAAICDE